MSALSPFRFLLVGVSLAALLTSSRACGPFLSLTLTDAADESALAPPARFFNEAILRYDRSSVPIIRSGDGPISDLTPEVETRWADVADLMTACAGQPVWNQGIALASYLALRDRYASAEFKQGGAGPALPLPCVPNEFVLYAEGAGAYARDDMPAARAIWEKLLALPVEQRRYRATWAAFMLGKSWGRENSEENTKWFERTRSLAREGMVDTLGLAASSYGWQARFLLTTEAKVTTGLSLYWHQLGTWNAETALQSMRDYAGSPFMAGSPASVMDAAARDPLARRVIATLLMTSSDGGSQANLDHWREALVRNGVREVENAAALATACYAAGEIDRAAAWLALAPPGDPNGQWLGAKLAMRTGRFDEAERLLTLAKRALRKNEPTQGNEFWQAYYGGETSGSWGHSDQRDAKPADQIAGDIALVNLTQGDFTGALDSFLNGDWWSDSAYVAEQLIDLPTLARYVHDHAKHIPPAAFGPPAPGQLPDADSAWRGNPYTPPRTTAERLGYLYARRLVRLGRYQEAMEWMPPGLQPVLREYVTALTRGRNSRLPQAERAAAFWDAAQIMRHSGMELSGAEVGPDWTVWDGNYSSEDHPRLGADKNLVIKTSRRERLLSAANIAQPDHRFHYRYRAADLAWEAAALMPDDDLRTATVLWTAGQWLQNKDPQAANRFYHALVRRCPNLPYAQEADRKRWFPDNPPPTTG